MGWRSTHSLYALVTLPLVMSGAVWSAEQGARDERKSLRWLQTGAPPSWIGQTADSHAENLTRSGGVRVVSAGAKGGGHRHPEHLVDGDPETEFTFHWGNGGGWVMLDLGRPCVLEGLVVTNASRSHRLVWLSGCSVGPDPDYLRDMLHGRVNLSMRGPSPSRRIPVSPSVGRFVRLEFSGGPSGTNGIGEVGLLGRENLPERHLMCWWSDLERDLVDKVDFFKEDLRVTDLWLDYVQTAFPQTNRNAGFDLLEASGLLGQLDERGIRYWLSEHEAFTQLVNGPADLADDAVWYALFRQMRYVYARARRLGFRGLVLDAEDYGGVSPEAKAAYQDVADHVTAFTFADEFGYGGLYYRRGLAYGKILKDVWDVPLLQVYEARLYAGIPGCRDGNYWWLKGIHDAGIEIWIATERTYGAGDLEIRNPASGEHLFRWFVDMRTYIPKVHAAYPFATRILPGFHPWNCRTTWPHYLPRYLDEQLRLSQACALGCWIYTEGLPRGGDPRHTLDVDILETYDIAAEAYLDVFRAHPTWNRDP